MSVSTAVSILSAVVAVNALSIVLLLRVVHQDLQAIAAAIRERGPDLRVVLPDVTPPAAGTLMAKLHYLLLKVEADLNDPTVCKIVEAAFNATPRITFHGVATLEQAADDILTRLTSLGRRPTGKGR